MRSAGPCPFGRPRENHAAMKLTFTPLLQRQRELYRIPRGSERFQAYLRQLID